MKIEHWILLVVAYYVLKEKPYLSTAWKDHFDLPGKVGKGLKETMEYGRSQSYEGELTYPGDPK